MSCPAIVAAVHDYSVISRHQILNLFKASILLISVPVVGERVKASPYAKKLAREAGVDVSQASPTGPEGRIVAADVQKLIESGGGKAAPKAEKAAPSGEAPPSAPQRAEVISCTTSYKTRVEEDGKVSKHGALKVGTTT